MTVTQLIKSSLRLIGELGAGQSAGPSMMADALLVLNSMLEAWSIERLAVYTIRRDVWDLTAGESSYLIGDLVGSTRPRRIEQAGLLPSGATTETELALLSLAQWRAGKYGLYDDRAYPYATISLNPAPAAGDQLVLYTWERLTEGFDDLDADVEFPPGYAEAIRTNLAVKLAPEFRLGLRADVREMAIEAKAAIKSVNIPTLEMSVDPALLARTRADGRV